MAIKWDSVPDYDLWGIDNWWNCQEWIMWHKTLVEHFGKENANEIWNYAFAKSGTLSGNLDCRSFNDDFRSYVSLNKLSPYQNAGIFKPVLKVYGTGADIVSGGIDTIGSISSGIFDTVKSVFGGTGLKKTITIVLIAGGVIGGAYVYSKFKKQ